MGDRGTRTMLNHIVEFSKFLNPASNNTLRILEGMKPLKGAMVGDNFELPAQKVVFVVAGKIDDGVKLTLCSSDIVEGVYLSAVDA